MGRVLFEERSVHSRITITTTQGGAHLFRHQFEAKGRRLAAFQRLKAGYALREEGVGFLEGGIKNPQEDAYRKEKGTRAFLSVREAVAPLARAEGGDGGGFNHPGRM